MKEVENLPEPASGDDDIGIICAVQDNFSGLWMPRHQLLTRLSSKFWTVWMEPPAYWHTDGFSFGQPSFESDTPFPKLLRLCNGYLAKVYRPRALGDAFDRHRLALARGALRKRGCKRLVLYIWRPQFAHYVDMYDWDLTIYHIDDEYSFSPDEPPISEQEQKLLESADRVIIHSPGLMEKKGHINPETIWIPNGVDFEAYSTSCPIPADLEGIPAPRIGYVGALKSQLDFDLLAGLADARPDWSFVFVGPRIFLGDQEAALNALTARPNVYELGMKDPSDLPAYTQHLDVATMCYRVDNYTKYIYPLKLHEYLASGVPVVSSPIRSALDFREAIALATGRDEWLSAIENAMSESANSTQARNKRMAIASEYDWDGLAERIAQTIRAGSV